MRIYTGWLFKDHFEYGHIEFEFHDVFSIKHYPSLVEATEPRIASDF